MNLNNYINKNMISLYDYILESLQINEAKFQNPEWLKHNKLYSNAVIDILTGNNKSQTQLALGTSSAERFIDSTIISDKTKEQLLKLKNTDGNYDSLVKQFNEYVKEYNFKWSDIWKGPFSGYDGEYSKNKGNAFEQEYIKYFNDKYKQELIDKCFEGNDFNVCDVSLDGKSNTRRPLQLYNNKLYAFPKSHNSFDDFCIGKYITDITLKTETTPIFLSLKYGNKVTFINVGVNNNNCFSSSMFNNENIDNIKFGNIGNLIIDIFGINKKLFVDTFNKYVDNGKKRNTAKLIDDISNKIDTDKFFTLLKSFIGFGYILVHKYDNGVIHYYDLRDKQQMEKFIGNKILNARIEYPKNYDIKRIDIFIELENIKLQLNIRSKNGGIYPTHLMSDYIIK